MTFHRMTQIGKEFDQKCKWFKWMLSARHPKLPSKTGRKDGQDNGKIVSAWSRITKPMPSRRCT